MMNTNRRKREPEKTSTVQNLYGHELKAYGVLAGEARKLLRGIGLQALSNCFALIGLRVPLSGGLLKPPGFRPVGQSFEADIEGCVQHYDVCM